MPAIYDVCLRLADWCLARSRLAKLTAALAVVASAVAVDRVVLRDFPNSGDEYVYLYQARTLADGHWVNQAPTRPESFAFNYIVFADGRAYGVFPVGWPLMLAGAIAFGIPTWLVNPVLGAISVFLVACLGSRLHSPRVGVLAALVVAVSPFFLFNAASYFSHTLCGALLLAAGCLAAREDRSPSWVPLGVGFLLGWAVTTRYFTGVVCGVPIVLWTFRRGGFRPRALVSLAAGGLPWVLLLAVSNNVLMGAPWHLSVSQDTVSNWFARGFIRHGADMTASHLLQFMLWTPPLLLVAYGAYLRMAPHETRRGALDWMLVFLAVGLYCYSERGGNQYGPRFYYEAFSFAAIYVVANLFRQAAFSEKSQGDRKLFALVAASVAVLPVILVVHAVIEHRVVRERMDLFDRSSLSSFEQSVLFISGRVGTSRSMAAEDLTRNGTTYSRRVLFALDLGIEQDCQTLLQLHRRSGYIYAWDARARSGTLRPIACAARPPERDARSRLRTGG